MCVSFTHLQVRQEFHSVGLMADVDVDPGCTLNKKIRNAQLAQYNFILGECGCRLPDNTTSTATASAVRLKAARLLKVVWFWVWLQNTILLLN